MRPWRTYCSIPCSRTQPWPPSTGMTRLAASKPRPEKSAFTLGVSNATRSCPAVRRTGSGWRRCTERAIQPPSAPAALDALGQQRTSEWTRTGLLGLAMLALSWHAVRLKLAAPKDRPGISMQRSAFRVGRWTLSVAARRANAIYFRGLAELLEQRLSIHASFPAVPLSR